MYDLITLLLTSLAMVLVIEGFFYALFPNAIKKMMANILSLPAEQVRISGLILAIIGVLLVWIIL